MKPAASVATMAALCVLAVAARGDPRHVSTIAALNTLREVESRLAIGNADGADDQLAHAEVALSGRTRLDVEAAREALGRSDLLPARQFIAAALAERRFR